MRHLFPSFAARLPPMLMALAACLVPSIPVAQQAEVGPLKMGYYKEFEKIEDGRIRGGMPMVPIGKSGVPVGMAFLRQHLERLSDHEEKLLDMCLGSHGDNQLGAIRGSRVLLNPDWFKNCEHRAAMLKEGVGALDIAFPVWNKFAGTRYTSPRGDSAILARWEEKKRSFVHFGGTACDDASREMVIPMARSTGDTDEQAFKRWSLRCNAQWQALFRPEPPQTATPKIVRPSAQESSLEDELAEIGARRHRGATGQDLTEDQKSASAVVGARARSGSGLVEGLEKGARSQPRAGSVGDIEIFGGKTGRMLEAALDPQRALEFSLSDLDQPPEGDRSASSCDVHSQVQRTQMLVVAAQNRASQLVEPQRSCALARAAVVIDSENQAFASRCRLGALELAQAQRTTDLSDAQARRACAATQQATQPAQTTGNCPAGHKWIGSSARSGFCWDGRSPFGNPNATTNRRN